MQALLERYARIDFYDEFADSVGVPRSHYAGLARTLRSIDRSDFPASRRDSQCRRASARPNAHRVC